MIMKFLLDEKNRVLMYGGEFDDATCDVELSDSDRAILDTYFSLFECFLQDGHIVLGDMLDLTPSEEEVLVQKREERKQLLTAFDKWEKAVVRGRETDNNEVMNWFEALLDLKDEAFVNIPERVKYYL